jgi:hypothetical protein
MVRPTFFLTLCLSVTVGQANAQTVDLVSRTFWLGERPKTMDESRPFIALLDIDWIDDILGLERVFERTVLTVEQFGDRDEHTATASLGWILSDQVELNPQMVPPEFRLPGYKIYGNPKSEKPRPIYVPNDPDSGYLVICGWASGRYKLSGCTLIATYAPDERIRLTARLYFPPDPIEQPTRFRDVVERLREVAYCLDVTEKLVDVPTVYPDLKGCKPEETS